MKPRLPKFFFMTLIASVMSLSSSSQVVINEFCFANYSDYGLGGGWNQEYEDWVEFYNPTGAAANIGGYFLSDNLNNPTKWEIPAGTTVPANGYLIILVSGTGDFDPGYLGELNTSFKLTQTAGEELVFTNPLGNVIETYDFDVLTPNQANHSWARDTNGGTTWSIHTDPTPEASNGGATGTSYAAKPTFSLQAGYYPGAVNVTIETTVPGATIRYTTNGNEPTAASTIYTGPVAINATTVLRARVYSSDPQILPGFIETNTYFIGPDQHTIKVTSVSGTTLGDGAWNGDELMHIEFFDENGNFLAEAQGDSNEHGNDSNAYPQRGFDYVTRDALGYDNEVQYPLINTTDRPSYERLIFKAAANDNYPFSNGAHIRDAYCHQLSILGGLHLDERSTESSILYINGQYWGVYEIREKVDDYDYTEYYRDQPEGFVDFLKTWGGTWEEYGSGDDWYELVDFITTNDMTNQANYDYVLTQYNHMSLIDYFVLNGYVVCTDWLNWNTAWWRGRNPLGDARRWRYALWDNDNTFGHGANFTGVGNTNPNADPCQIDDMGDVGGQGHVPVLNALFDNEEFLADYIQRYATLSNSIFSCDRMIEVLDSMIAVIEPEMQRQIDRWGGTMAGWQNNVQEVRDFILQRCNNTIIDGLEDCYDVTAYTLTIQFVGDGEIEVQEVEINSNQSPFSGTYFGDLPIDLIANVTDCGSFGGWEIISGTGTLSSVSDPITTLTISSDVTISVTFTESTGTSELILDVQPAGAGIINLSGNEINAFPYTENFALNTDQTLTATANEWFIFEGWESTDFDFTPNADAETVTINTCSTGTVTALFTEIPHATLYVGVEPAGTGTINMNGTPLPSYPWEDVVEADLNYNFQAFEIPGVTVFDHWEINNHTLSPNELTAAVVLNLQVDDSLVAVFRVLETATLQVSVTPPGAGTVTMDGSLLTLPFSEDFLTDLDYNFVTAPVDEWSEFVGWQLDNHTLTPSATSTNVTLNLQTDDHLIAVYNVIPHQLVTVIVEPSQAGTVLFDASYQTRDERTEVIEGMTTLPFRASADEYYNFSHWEVKYGSLAGDEKELSVGIMFNEVPDTVIAHFTKEEMTYYIPNSFSPNGDGVNDVFKPFTNAIAPEYYEFSIFNRWGDRVFYSVEPDKAWEGDYQGGSYYLPDGVYTYFIKLKWVHAEEFEEIHGTVMIIR